MSPIIRRHARLLAVHPIPKTRRCLGDRHGRSPLLFAPVSDVWEIAVHGVRNEIREQPFFEAGVQGVSIVGAARWWPPALHAMDRAWVGDATVLRRVQQHGVLLRIPAAAAFAERFPNAVEILADVFIALFPLGILLSRVVRLAEDINP